MAHDIRSGVQTTRTDSPDLSLAAGAAACVASNALGAADARLLLDALGLTEVAPIAAAVLRINRKETR